ncbi:MAG: UDP-N-acetylglucosamine 1-carboxyvinyltransferase [Candidatus Harrisonbacteria bacterium RIFCSPHIGHO2_01_FULL_44_13]|uniref:UDP-N-acetylglucosamine 1-carboxyvinyltransferase n=1 Tax=Candidatus Harrisonbacteria bacterium RIFCSPLOWO2_01_FULL_44_18 TaxID=1798407 RepID=A0A1G1ZQ29_9BACT|nr:MAG: UDP-N-acetylglucosamine 1-carboxyvinyltransferase [Candidatus Harrisonbacteria bacterium RIFCSPHIGHO2_01_FULL_44_13]OGY65860.1 MAG: UDP-N-acetylglucosamine 1-carboxyvinyltransferase [Candidatus Harrisonbacteria bacterium RIFCSPLOWO2_01_FULL_44_18]
MKFVIKGGRKLNGEISLSGAKNAATKMMVASLLTEEACSLENFPEIGDGHITAELCRSVGSKVDIQSGRLDIHTPEIKTFRVTSLTRRNRIPILALGPLLARVGKAEVPILGGDKIGPRPVDIHLDALRVMGAAIKINQNSYAAEAKNGLHGAKIALRFPSVGATENTILAAVLAKGRTIIQNAATEPEITDLIKMLQKMGAIISLGTNRTIYIDGVDKLRGARHRILPDRNEAVSFACLAVATGGRILVKGARQDDLITFLNMLRRVGGEYDVLDDGIAFYRRDNLRGVEVETDTHPGFMTDWQQPFTILLTQAKGNSIIHETIYEDRFGYTKDLNLMGADITVFTKCLGELSCRFSGENYQHSALINGPTPLKAANLEVRDLRSGIAHIIAALIAEGESVISGVEEIDRGYERIDERLGQLGADIKRVH